MTKFIALALCFTWSFLHAQKQQSKAEVGQETKYIAALQKSILGEYEEAIRANQDILEADPLNAAVHHNIARLYWNENEPATAYSHIDKAITFDADNYWYRLTYAHFLQEDKKYEELVSVLQGILPLKRNTEILENLAQAQSKAEYTQDAIDTYNILLTDYGYEPRWVKNQIELYDKLNDKSSIDKTWNQSTQTYDDPDLWRSATLYYAHHENTDKQRFYLQRWLAAEPENEEAQEMMAILELEQEDSPRSSSIAQVINDDRVDIDYKIKTLYPILQQYIDTPDSTSSNLLQQSTKSLVEQYPESGKAHALRGDYLYHSHRYEDAFNSFKAATSYAPNMYPLWLQALRSLSFTQDYDSLADFAQESLDYFPNNGAPYLYLGLAQSFMEDTENAKYNAEEAEFIGIDEAYETETLALLNARLLALDNKLGAAIQTIEKYIKENPNHSSRSLEYLGDLHAQNNHQDKAQEYYQKALQQGGDKMRLTEKLKK